MVNFDFESIKKELSNVEKDNKKQYYFKKYLEVEDKYYQIQKINLNWIDKVKYELIKMKYNKKERAWVNFQLNMYYQERTEYKKYKIQFEGLFKDRDNEKSDILKIKLIYEKMEKTIKKIIRYKEMINEYIEEKNTYKEVSELSKSMIDLSLINFSDSFGTNLNKKD